MTQDILKEAIYNHVSHQREPITALEVGCAMQISAQKASALLNALCYENRIKWVPYHSKKGYGIEKVIKGYGLDKVVIGYNYKTNNTDTSIKIDWEVVNESTIEFDTEKPMSYKEKIFKTIYEILLDYFN